MPSPLEQLRVELPETLRRQFAALERRLWKTETAAAVCLAAAGLALSYVALFFSDRLWDSPVWFRFLLALAGTAVWIWAVVRWSALWIFKRRDLRALAVLVQRKHRRLGDRLLGIVELASEHRHTANFSPALYRAAIEQVAAEAEQLNFIEAVDPRPVKRRMAAVMTLAAVVILLFALAPVIGWNVLQRWAMPLGDIPRETLVNVAGLPPELIVPHGEAFVTAGAVRYRSFWKPARVTAQYERQSKVIGAARSGDFQLRIPGQFQSGALKIKVGDAQAGVRIVPSHRPALKELSASVELPPYLKHPVTEQDIRNGSLQLLEGSRVAFRGQATRPLHAAELITDGDERETLTVTNDAFHSELLARHDLRHVAFVWQDHLGLTNLTPHRVAVRLQKDLPPVLELPGLGRDTAVLFTDVLDIKAVARDDFGVFDLGLNWDIVAGLDQGPGIGITEIKMQTSSTDQKRVEDTFQWSPTIFRVPPDSVVELRAFARDYLPGRERTYSGAYRIHVLGHERHAELVRQKLESLLVRLEEITRFEEKILANTMDLSESDKLDDPGVAERLEKLANDQLRNAANLDELAREGLKTLREALRNAMFPSETVQDWSENLRQMQQLSEGEMQEAAGDLQSAQQNAGQRAGDVASAQEKQEEILAALQQMQGKVNEDLDDLQAMTLAQRLRRLGAAEKEIESHLQTAIAESIGLLPRELPENLAQLNQTMGEEQEDIRDESAALKGEITRFYERTQKPNYGEVSDEFTTLRTVEEVERVRKMIEQNIAMQAMRHLAVWSGRFNEWADKLEPPPASGGGGEGGGEQQEMVNMTKYLIELLRLREKEMNLLQQTRLLEEQKAEPLLHEDRAVELAFKQRLLMQGLDELQQENPLPELEDLLQETADAMGAVELLLQLPQTGEETQQGEIKTIELLTDAINIINEQAQRMQPQPGEGEGEGADQMAFLLQMMTPGMGTGMAMSPGGGSQAGGTTERIPGENTRNAEGRAGQERNVHKASGATLNLPAEFRDALQQYFEAIEQEGE